jgi:hypothetical protein
MLPQAGGSALFAKPVCHDQRLARVADGLAEDALGFLRCVPSAKVLIPRDPAPSWQPIITTRDCLADS